MKNIHTVYQIPSKDSHRLRILQEIVFITGPDGSDGDEFIRAELIAEAGRLLPLFSKATNKLSETLANRAIAVSVKDRAFTFLQWGTRDAWSGVKRRARRQELGTAVLIHYGLTEAGKPPSGTAQRDWLYHSNEVLDGNREAIAAGYPPIQNPDAAELQLLHDTAETALYAVPRADRKHDRTQAAVEALRGPVNDLLASVVRDMRYYSSVAGMDRESTRRVMRGYGFMFRTMVVKTAVKEESTAA